MDNFCIIVNIQGYANVGSEQLCFTRSIENELE